MLLLETSKKAIGHDFLVLIVLNSVGIKLIELGGSAAPKVNIDDKIGD